MPHPAHARSLAPTPRRSFARLTGDDNPIHLDADYARRSPFGRPIAHGLLFASLIPTIFGATIEGCVYVEQTLRFKRPVYVGDTVRARVEVVAVRDVPAKRARGGDGAAASAGDEAAPRPHQQLVTCSTVILRVAAGEGGGALLATPELCLEGSASVLLPLPSSAAAPHAQLA